MQEQIQLYDQRLESQYKKSLPLHKQIMEYRQSLLSRGYSNQEVAIQLPIDELTKLQRLAHAIQDYRRSIKLLKHEMSLSNCIGLMRAKRDYSVQSSLKYSSSTTKDQLFNYGDDATAEYNKLAQEISLLDCPYLANFKNIQTVHIVKASFGNYSFLQDLRFDLLKQLFSEHNLDSSLILLQFQVLDARKYVLLLGQQHEVSDRDMLNELQACFDRYFSQFLILLFLITISGDKAKKLQPDNDKSALCMLQRLQVLNADKARILCVFNEVFTRLQLKFEPDFQLINSILGQTSFSDLSQELDFQETLRGLISRIFDDLSKQLEQIKYISYTSGAFAELFEKLNKKVSRLYNSLHFLKQTKWYSAFAQEFIAYVSRVSAYFKEQQLTSIKNTGQNPRELAEQIDKIYKNQEYFLTDAGQFVKDLQTLAKNLKFTGEYSDVPALNSLPDVLSRMRQQLADNRLSLIYQLKEQLGVRLTSAQISLPLRSQIQKEIDLFDQLRQRVETRFSSWVK